MNESVARFAGMTQDQMADFADEVGNPPGDPLFGNEYEWRFEPSFDWRVMGWSNLQTSTIGGVLSGPGVKWARGCLPGWPAGNEQYKDWLDNPQMPLVLVCVNGQWDLWDGAHRLAAALLKRRYAVPALIGVNREKDPEKWHPGY